MAGLYKSLTGDDKKYQMLECYKKAKTDISALNSLTSFMSRKYYDDDDISIYYGDIWFAIAELHYDSMVKCPGIDNQYFDK